MFGKAKRQAIFQFIGSGVKYTWLFLVLSTNQVKSSPPHNDLDSETLQQTPIMALKTPEEKLDKIRKLFRAFAGKCAESEFYDQILPPLTDLLSVIEQELKNADSSIEISSRSTVAKSKLFQIANILSQNTYKDLVIDLKKIYSPVSAIFKWNLKTKSAFMREYKSKHRWNVAKDWIEGPLKIIMTPGSAIILLTTLIGILLNPKKAIASKYKDENTELKKQIDENKVEILSKIDSTLAIFQSRNY